ncbi:UPF0042 nucleotide-binding protein [Loktanella ponticola]|uniref:UPF0042 nucleotide-binding protein n=1 Tax=Yoonia ponticola TaxID=1524255 RepID=A0A7W9BIC0_9RHOB|nr:RNase adapter RapZ [Yoonia ponticola]MBB5720689.1 UPF0042 nucleotide-binding protein [Yoonia ponticola]
MTSDAPLNPPATPVVIVTGPSGAGRSTAVNALEDLGFEVIDNLPLSLLPRLLDGPQGGRPLALGVDVRNRDFAPNVLRDIIEDLHGRDDVNGQVLYLDASEDVLVRRYSETRRRHPLSPDGTPLTGIDHEIKMLSSIRALADILVDTTDLSPHDLKADIERHFAVDGGPFLGVTLHSFSYKRGLPRGLDIVMDCRFLRNPHWDPALRAKDGRDAQVYQYVAADDRFGEFFTKMQDLVMMLLPAYKDEGKSHLSIGFGCTGGQHRSVAVTEKLAAALEMAGWPVSIRHRELERREGTSVTLASRHTA